MLVGAPMSRAAHHQYAPRRNRSATRISPTRARTRPLIGYSCRPRRSSARHALPGKRAGTEPALPRAGARSPLPGAPAPPPDLPRARGRAHRARVTCLRAARALPLLREGASSSPSSPTKRSCAGSSSISGYRPQPRLSLQPPRRPSSSSPASTSERRKHRHAWRIASRAATARIERRGLVAARLLHPFIGLARSRPNAPLPPGTSGLPRACAGAVDAGGDTRAPSGQARDRS